MAGHEKESMIAGLEKERKTWVRRFLDSWTYDASHTQSSRQSGLPSRDESTLAKLLPIPGLVITTALSSALVYGISHPPYVNDNLYAFITSNRSSIQAILSILTSIFGFAHLYVLTSVFNFLTRIYLTQYAPSLDHLKWWKAISSKSVDWSLPFKLLVSVVVFFAFTLVPATLWTGALTPNLVTLEVPINITLPYYGLDRDGTAWNQTWVPTRTPSVVRNANGTFSYTPAYDRGGSMINTAAGVINNKDLTGQRPRSDKTGYTYGNRSYGVGASVGLLDLDCHDCLFATAYNFNETGYHTSVTCGSNSSSKWGIELVDANPSPLAPSIYICKGATPDNAMDWYLKYTQSNDSSIVAIDAHADHVKPGKGIVAIAAGTGSYSSLNNTQCSVTFVPTLFNVHVNLTTKVINVTDVGPANDMDPTARSNESYKSWTCESLPPVIDRNTTFKDLKMKCDIYTTQGKRGMGNIALNALRQLVDLSTLDTSLVSSSLGDMFLSDIENENKWIATNLDQAHSSNATAYAISYSVEQAIKSLLDDSLLAFSSATLVLANTTTIATGNLTVGAIIFGTKGYEYSLLAFNIILILVLIEEMIRTRGWKHLPLFDYNDIKSVIIASSMGGSAIADKVMAAHKERNTTWVANPTDSLASHIRVQLNSNGEQGSIELVTVDQANYKTIDTAEGYGPWKGTPQVRTEDVDDEV